MNDTSYLAVCAFCGVTFNSKEEHICIPQHGNLRDQFAMAAMNGLMSTYWETQDEYTSGAELVKCQCESAYEYADEMLKAREGEL